MANQARLSRQYKKRGPVSWNTPRSSIAKTINNIHSTLERGLYIQIGCIEQVGIVSHFHWRISAFGIPSVTTFKVEAHVVNHSVLPTASDFPRSPPRAFFEIGRDEELHVSLRANKCPDIATVDHGTARLAGKPTLGIQERVAHGWQHGDSRSRLANRMGRESVAV